MWPIRHHMESIGEFSFGVSLAEGSSRHISPPSFHQAVHWPSPRWLSSGIETMTIAPPTSIRSTYPGAGQCLCAADAQAKQEGTGDPHWELRMQTHVNRPSQC